MSNIVVRHGQDDQLGHRSRVAAYAPGPLVDAGKVRIHIAGIAAPTGHFFAGSRHLAQRLAVVGHIGQDHQHVAMVSEGQVFGGSKSCTGREQTLKGGIVCAIDEHHRAIHCIAGAELVHKE